MTDKTIRRGDLVMVVKPQICCGNTANIGYVFRVLDLRVGRSACVYCAKVETSMVVCDEPNGGFVPERLIKIDPPAVPIRRDDEVTA